MKTSDIVAIFITAIFVVVALILIKVNNGRFYNIFVK
jgi:cobalt transport protein